MNRKLEAKYLVKANLATDISLSPQQREKNQRNGKKAKGEVHRKKVDVLCLTITKWYR